MTQDKINKVVELCNESLKALDKMITLYPQGGRGGGKSFMHENWTMARGKIIDAKSLLQSDNEKTYTRKQLQEACSKAYYRGVDNKPILDRFDEHLNEKDNAKLALYYNDNQWHCSKCDGVVYVGNDRCRRCGQKLTWPDNQNKSEES